MPPDTPHEQDPLFVESSSRGPRADWITRAVDWTRRTLQSDYRDHRELGELLEREHQSVLDLWAELSVASGYRWTAPRDLAQDRQIADLCLQRLTEALTSEAAVLLETDAEEELFSFAATLAEYGTRARIPLDDLIQHVLVLRRAIHQHVRKDSMVSAPALTALDRFLDKTVIALTRQWLSTSRADMQFEESKLEGILSVNQELLTTLDPNSAQNSLAHKARELSGADAAALLMLDPTGHRLEARAVDIDLEGVRAALPLAFEGCASGQAMRTFQTVTSLELGSEAACSAFRGTSPLSEHPPSIMAAPVLVAGQVRGALEVASFEPRIFTPDEVKTLGMLADQAGLVWENEWRQRQALEAERARSLREIQMAQKVQRALLTVNHLEHGALSIGACLEPSREVGGDYYDFFATGADLRQVAVHIGDVSGKGIPAALLVAMAKYVVRSHALPEVPGPGEVLQRTNETFCSDLSEDMAMFVTACYALVDADGRELRYASAGHPPPLIVRGSLMQTPEERAGAAPLNLIPELTFMERRVPLCPGDLVVLYTDGVLEARNTDEEWFGLNGLRRALRDCNEDGPAAIARTVVEAVRRFQAGRPLADDTTVVVLKVKGRPAEKGRPDTAP